MGVKMVLWIFFFFTWNTGDKPNYRHVAHRRPRKTVPFIYHSKREEIWGHGSPNPSNWSSTCRAASQHRGTGSRSIIPPASLSRAATGQPLVSSHRQGRRQRSRQIYVQISQEVTVRCLTWLWLSMLSLHQYYSKFLVLNKCYSFLKSLLRPRFCEGTGKGATWPKVKQDHWARIEGRKTQFMKPVWQPIKYLRQLFARWPRSMRRDWEWDVNHAGGRCSCCLCLHVVKTLRFLP